MTTDQISPVSAIGMEAQRVEEDCLYSSRGHFGAAKRWAQAHFWLGLPASVIAALAGATAVSSHPYAAVSLAAVVTALTATLTFLNPSDKASVHHAAGTRFNTVRNEARRFREVTLRMQGETAGLAAQLADLAKQRDVLNENSPQIPRWAFLDARRSISEGEAAHRVD